MPWYVIAVVLCILVGPFHALHVYNKAQERKRKRQESAAAGGEAPKDP